MFACANKSKQWCREETFGRSWLPALPTMLSQIEIKRKKPLDVQLRYSKHKKLIIIKTFNPLSNNSGSSQEIFLILIIFLIKNFSSRLIKCKQSFMLSFDKHQDYLSQRTEKIYKYNNLYTVKWQRKILRLKCAHWILTRVQTLWLLLSFSAEQTLNKLPLFNVRKFTLNFNAFEYGFKQLRFVDEAKFWGVVSEWIILAWEKNSKEFFFHYSVRFLPAEYEYESKFFTSRPDFQKVYDKGLKNNKIGCFIGCVYDEGNQQIQYSAHVKCSSGNIFHPYVRI